VTHSLGRPAPGGEVPTDQFQTRQELMSSGRVGEREREVLFCLPTVKRSEDTVVEGSGDSVS